ncbi:FAD-binding oxidoreductase [Shimia sp. R9_3]|nr:FAD-binding oxidoreductase [Shimia sp. R9_3]
MTRYAAKSLPVHRGAAAWNAILGDQGEAAELDSDMTADFAVIGGGFAGLAAARRLRQLQPDARIVVLEAGRIGEGASGRNSGFMIDLPHELSSKDYAGSGDDRLMTRLNRQAIAFGKAAVEDYRIDPNFFDEAGKVNGAAGDAALAHNATYAQHLESMGEPFSLLDAKQMQDLTGSAHYNGGLYTPGTVMLQPAGYVRGLAAGLQRDGVEILENSGVIAFVKEGLSWKVEALKGSVSTGAVILTVNGHLESFGVAKGRLLHLFLFAMMTPELDADQIASMGGQSRWGITPSDPMGTTMRRIDEGQGGNRIITRTSAVLRPGMRTTDTDMKRSALAMRRKFDQRYPLFADMQMEHHWAGHLCLSLNGVSHAHEIEKGVYSGCVQNGLGATRGTLTGITAAELACGVQSEISDHFRFEISAKKLPPNSFLGLGGNLFLRWKQLRARNE